MHPCQQTDETLLGECAVRADRRSGPGGQHRNKVQTAVILEHLPSGTRAEASERRSQSDNRRVALYRLRLALALEVRTERETSPSPLWLGRVRGGRMIVAADHHDYPALLAEALDHLARCGWDVALAATRLSVSASQLVRLLRKHSPALSRLNAERESLGLRPLK